MTGSNSAKNELIKVGIPAKNIQIINHGVVIQKPRVMPKKEKTNTIIFLGAISKDKGIGDVLETFRELSKKGKYKYWIVGRSSDMYRKLIKSSARKFGFANDLTYFGFVDEKKKSELLAKAHLLINPSLLEGWGLVNIEANSMGTPVVAYNSPGLIDSVKNDLSGMICKENNPRELSKLVFKILENKNLYKKLQNGARGWSAKFDWKASKKLSLALVEKIGLK